MKYLFFSIILLIVISSCLYAFDTKGLVLYLKLDEGSGKIAKDSSGDKNDGELQGNVEWVDGKIGKAVKASDTSGGDMIVVKDSPSLDITDQMTIGMWVMIETVPDGSCSLITKADTYMIHSSNWSGKGIEQELLLWPFDLWQSPASTPIQLNQWKHVIGTFDGKVIKMFVDGKLMGQRGYANKIAVTNNDVVIGRDSRACCNTRRSKLTFDEVVIFNRALADNEVKEVMVGGGKAVDMRDHITALWGYIKSNQD